MKDLRLQKNYRRRNPWPDIKAFIYKKWLSILIVTLVALIVIFPTQSGIMVGQWIHDFFGNIIKYSGF